MLVISHKRVLYLSSFAFFVFALSLAYTIPSSRAEFNWNIIVTQEKTAEGKTYAKVTVRNITLIQLYSVQGVPALDKAKVIEQRLRAFIRLKLSPSAIKVSQHENQTVVVVGDYLLATVSPDEAKLHGMSVESLAMKWRNALKTALTEPVLALKPFALLIPAGETRRIQVTGTAKGMFSFSEYDPSLLSVSYDEKENVIFVLGKQIGDSMLVAQREGVSFTVSVMIRPYAGAVSKYVPEAQVTGNPCPKSVVLSAALRNLPDALLLQPETSYKILTKRIQSPAKLLRGESAYVSVPVKIYGEDYVPALVTVNIPVQNEALLPQEASFLAVSNHPENISGPGILLEAALLKDTPVRLLYHHKNVSKNFPFDFLVQVYNPGEKPVSLLYIRGNPAPSKHEIAVGKLAANMFLENYQQEVGEIFTIPPKSFVTLYKKQIPRKHVLSGISYIRCLTGEMLYLQVKAKQSYETDTAPMDAFVLMPSARKGIFPNPEFHVEKVYTVGEKWLFISVGDTPMFDVESGQKFLGNYGAFYHIYITLNNPAEKQKKVLFYFEPAGGVAAGILFLDGKKIDIRPINYPHEKKFGVTYLSPYESKTVYIKTMPISGSYYPVRIVVRS